MNDYSCASKDLFVVLSHFLNGRTEKGDKLPLHGVCLALPPHHVGVEHLQQGLAVLHPHRHVHPHGQFQHVAL